MHGPAPAVAQYYNVIITPYASLGVADTIRTPLLKKQTLGVSPGMLAAMRVYPNPATTNLHLSFPTPFEGTVSLYNVSGVAVFSGNVSKREAYDIATSGFATGIYTLIVKDVQGLSEIRQVSIRQ